MTSRNWWQDCCRILYHELLILSKSCECHVTLTMPLSQILVNLLRASQILTFESPAGIKGNLIRTFATVPVTRMCREPHERAWLPVVMVTHYCRRSSDMHLWVGLRSESLSPSLSLFVFVSVSVSFLPLPLPIPPSLFLPIPPSLTLSLPPPLSLSLSLSLSSLLLLLLLLACDTWLDTVAQGRTNPPPDKIPWSTFRTISPYMEDVLITLLISYVTPTHLINNCYQLTAHT